MGEAAETTKEVEKDVEVGNEPMDLEVGNEAGVAERGEDVERRERGREKGRDGDGHAERSHVIFRNCGPCPFLTESATTVSKNKF